MLSCSDALSQPEYSDLLIFNSNSGGTLHPQSVQIYCGIQYHISVTRVYQYDKTQRKNSALFYKETTCPKMIITFSYKEYKNVDIYSQHTSSLWQRTKREQYLADNLTDVLTWLKASVNFGYEVGKKKRKGKKNSIVPAEYA